VRIRLIGVGTARGDDAAGLAAAERLAATPLPPGVEVAACERPADLPELLADADAALLIDALAPAGQPGRVRTVGREELARAGRLSSHALGVAEGLALAEALGRSPARVEILGIEAERSQGDSLSEAVRRGVDEAVAQARARVAALAAEAAGASGPPAGPEHRATPAPTSLHQPSGRASLGFAFATATMLLWAVLPLALGGVLRHLDPATITWFRFSVSALVLAAVLAHRGALPGLRGIRRGGLVLLATATFGLAANYIAFLVGLAWTGEASAQVLIQLAPVLLSLGGIAIFGERFAPVQWLGFAVLVLGLALFSTGRIRELPDGSSARYLAGVAMIGLAAVTWAGYGLAQKQLLRHLSPQGVMLCIYAGCALCFAPFARPAALATLAPAPLGLLLFTAANTLLAYGAFATALAHWEASRVSAVLAVGPLATVGFAALAGALVPGWLSPEPLPGPALAGAGLVVAGSLATALGRRR
jgi:hydrogenase maturation protease